MKKALYLILIATGLSLVACDYDNQKLDPDEFEYHSHIHSPDGAEKQLGDTLHIEVEFESHTGAELRHINVRIYNKVSQVEIYSQPTDPHLDVVGEYTFEDEFVLSTANGVTASSDWVLEASVWAEEDGDNTVSETVEFHVGS